MFSVLIARLADRQTERQTDRGRSAVFVAYVGWAYQIFVILIKLLLMPISF